MCQIPLKLCDGTVCVQHVYNEVCVCVWGGGGEGGEGELQTYGMLPWHKIVKYNMWVAGKERSSHATVMN